MPTSDEYAVGRTIVRIGSAAAEMQKRPYFDFGIGTNVCAGRDSVLKVAKEVLGGNSGRILWIDFDIVVNTPPGELAKYLNEAEDKNYNIVAPYRRIDKYSSISRTTGEILKWDEIGTLEQYETISWAGLGFYYGHTPFDYKFHMSGEAGEDYHFFADNKIELRVDKRIVLYHNKRIFI